MGANHCDRRLSEPDAHTDGNSYCDGNIYAYSDGYSN
jgi:hypothetical protein